jgi:transcriptional regulator with XRE-family HTH domain
MAKDPVDIGAAIRKLRESCSLTQVELANELGIAPGSVYRYEAGTSRPNLGVLHNLWNFALKHNAPYAASDFSDALASLAGTPITFEDDTLERQRAIDASTAALRPHEQHLAMAFVQMLKGGADETVMKVIKVILEPWMGIANEELTKQRQKDAVVERQHAESKETQRRARKHPRK